MIIGCVKSEPNREGRDAQGYLPVTQDLPLGSRWELRRYSSNVSINSWDTDMRDYYDLALATKGEDRRINPIRYGSPGSLFICSPLVRHR